VVLGANGQVAPRRGPGGRALPRPSKLVSEGCRRESGEPCPPEKSGTSATPDDLHGLSITPRPPPLATTRGPQDGRSRHTETEGTGCRRRSAGPRMTTISSSRSHPGPPPRPARAGRCSPSTRIDGRTNRRPGPRIGVGELGIGSGAPGRAYSRGETLIGRLRPPFDHATAGRLTFDLKAPSSGS
jgi:hypothetical protein